MKNKEERFWSKVNKTDSCWLWTAYTDKDGYGTFHGFTSTYAHRISYELQNGPVTNGLEIDHLCRNRACVNPKHLETVTHTTNIRRGTHSNSLKTHCKNGHSYSGTNLYLLKNERRCKSCLAANSKRWYLKK